MVKPTKDDQFTVELILPSRVIIILGILINLYEAIIHINDAPAFSTQNLGFLIFNVTGYLFLIFLNRVRRKDILTNKDWFRIGSNTALTFISIFVSQIIISYFLEAERYTVTNLDIFLFFISAAIAEETLFRGLIITSTDLAISRIINNKIARFFIMALTSTVIFVIGHYAVYGDNNLLLLDVWIGGFIFSTSFIITKGDYFAVVIAHIANNIIYAGVVITNSIFNALEVTPANQAISVIALILMIFVTTAIISRFDKNERSK